VLFFDEDAWGGVSLFVVVFDYSTCVFLGCWSLLTTANDGNTDSVVACHFLRNCPLCAAKCSVLD